MGQKMYPYELYMQAVTEVLNKSHYGNSHLQMRQKPITIAKHSGPYPLKTWIKGVLFAMAVFTRIHKLKKNL